MKKGLLLVVVMLATIAVKAQDIYVGGSLNVWRNSTGNTTSFKVAPEVGYNFNETWALGAELDYSHNYNGGLRRSIKTLSGGETFLTSLALALALSSQIQLKGSAPLEFFFLDEGFGSLDSELLDIVMESLEKLHSEKLSVGIISHVEELKNRVPVKLLVTPNDGGNGSKINIEYS